LSGKTAAITKDWPHWRRVPRTILDLPVKVQQVRDIRGKFRLQAIEPISIMTDLFTEQ
jgi:hypothetical protein